MAAGGMRCGWGGDRQAWFRFLCIISTSGRKASVRQTVGTVEARYVGQANSVR